MKRYDIINSIIESIKATDYLEIGVAAKLTFNNVVCKNKTSVDPSHESKYDYNCTSNEFFEHYCPLDKKYDVIFIDGLHLFEQVFDDIKNSLKHLNPGGVIVSHDNLPEREEHQIRKNNGGVWNGDCWKATAKIIDSVSSEAHLKVWTVDTDYGCSIFYPIQSYPIELDHLSKDFSKYTWEYYNLYKKDILHVISVDQFKNDVLLKIKK